jgi:hypothetical protein
VDRGGDAAGIGGGGEGRRGPILVTNRRPTGASPVGTSRAQASITGHEARVSNDSITRPDSIAEDRGRGDGGRFWLLTTVPPGQARRGRHKGRTLQRSDQPNHPRCKRPGDSQAPGDTPSRNGNDPELAGILASFPAQ